MKPNPTQGIPTSDEQAEVALRHERTTITADSLCGIYRCKRELGYSVIDAYMAALQAHIDAFEKGR